MKAVVDLNADKVRFSKWKREDGDYKWFNFQTVDLPKHMIDVNLFFGVAIRDQGDSVKLIVQ